MAQHQLLSRNNSGKLPVGIKYQNLHSFKGMIHVCQTSLKRDEYHIYMAQFSLQSL